MKLPKLLFQDYLVGGFVIIVLASVFVSEGIISGIFYFLGISALLYILYGVIVWAYKTTTNDGFDGLIKNATFKLLQVSFSSALILTAATLLWIGFKLFFVGLTWLKDGYWLYEHYSVCSVLEFNCLPNTGFVKINQFLAWLYGFDIEFWLIVAPWALATIFWFLDAPSEDKTK